MKEHEWSIDWGWYDKMIKEDEEKAKKHVEPLIDLNYTETASKKIKMSVNEKLLYEIFSNTKPRDGKYKEPNSTNSK
jgi:hypothetical protein